MAQKITYLPVDWDGKTHNTALSINETELAFKAREPRYAMLQQQIKNPRKLVEEIQERQKKYEDGVKDKELENALLSFLGKDNKLETLIDTILPSTSQQPTTAWSALAASKNFLLEKQQQRLQQRLPPHGASPAGGYVRGQSTPRPGPVVGNGRPGMATPAPPTFLPPPQISGARAGPVQPSPLRNEVSRQPTQSRQKVQSTTATERPPSRPTLQPPFPTALAPVPPPTRPFMTTTERYPTGKPGEPVYRSSPTRYPTVSAPPTPDQLNRMRHPEIPAKAWMVVADIRALPYDPKTRFPRRDALKKFNRDFYSNGTLKEHSDLWDYRYNLGIFNEEMWDHLMLPATGIRPPRTWGS